LAQVSSLKKDSSLRVGYSLPGTSLLPFATAGLEVARHRSTMCQTPRSVGIASRPCIKAAEICKHPQHFNISVHFGWCSSMRAFLLELARQVHHELSFSDLGATFFTLLALWQYIYVARMCLVSSVSAAAAPAFTIAVIELAWQAYSRFVLLRWLDQHCLPLPNQAEWKKGAAYLVDTFSGDFRAIWEHLCEDSLENISRETALDVLHCLVPPAGSPDDSASLQGLLREIEEASAQFKFPETGQAAKGHRMTGIRNSIAPFSRHLPLLVTGVGGLLAELSSLMWLLLNGWQRHICKGVPVSYWTKGSRSTCPMTLFCPGFGNLTCCHLFVSQRLLKTCQDQRLILLDFRWYSCHAFAPRQPSWGDVADAVKAILPKQQNVKVSLVSHSGGTILANKLVGRGCSIHSVVLMEPAIFNPPWTSASVNSFRFPVNWACNGCRAGVLWEDTPFVAAYSRCAQVTVLLSEKDLLVPPRTGMPFLFKLRAVIGSRLQVIIDHGANHGALALEPLRPAVGAALAGQGMTWSDVEQLLETKPLPTAVSGLRLLSDLLLDGFGCMIRTLQRAPMIFLRVHRLEASHETPTGTRAHAGTKTDCCRKSAAGRQLLRRKSFGEPK